MDEFKTGVFEISTGAHDFLKDWQEELAKEDLERRARAAMKAIQKPGVPYVTCIYPAVRVGNKLVLTGWIALAFWQDCEVGDCVFSEYNLFQKWHPARDREFEHDASTSRHGSDREVHLYRRLR